MQALTTLIYIAVGLAATLLFLNGAFITAFNLTMIVTQGWRTFSEILRADYRGGAKYSPYQIMGLVAIIFAAVTSYFLPVEGNLAVELTAGIAAAWQPSVMLLLQALWAVVFVMFGKSMVTGAQISFHLHHDRV